MADTDVLIKDLPLTETVNDSDDLVTEDSSPTTHRIKASVVKNYINAEQNEELDGLKVDLDNANSNIGSLSSKVDDATTTVSSMQTNLNTMDGRVQANADGISELNSALTDLNLALTFASPFDLMPDGTTGTTIQNYHHYSYYSSASLQDTYHLPVADGGIGIVLGSSGGSRYVIIYISRTLGRFFFRTDATDWKELA